MSTEPLPLFGRLQQAQVIATLREAQREWRSRPLERRLAILRAARQGLAGDGVRLAEAVRPASARPLHETITAELLPLLAACRFLERESPRLLAPRRLGTRGRPPWLASGQGEILREPHGVVLIVGPANYPLFLPGVQAVQALVAGNAVLWKPGRGGRPCAQALREVLIAAGLPRDVLVIAAEAPVSATTAIAVGVDKIVLTGHADTGRAVLAQAAATLVPAVMELSGCDAMIVRADADPELAADAVAFGLALNSGATCIAPRRVLVVPTVMEAFTRALLERLPRVPPAHVEAATRQQLRALLDEARTGGARVLYGDADPVSGDRLSPLVVGQVTAPMKLARSDLFAPVVSVMPVRDDEEAVAIVNDCPYRLGASVFGRPGPAGALAARLDVGTVTINDVIVPTADPRTPFGGRGASGFGVTRGAEGLLDMTRPKVVWRKPARRRLHHRPIDAVVGRVIAALPALFYGSVATRFDALHALVSDFYRSTPPSSQEHSA